PRNEAKHVTVMEAVTSIQPNRNLGQVHSDFFLDKR
ncbi:hypothetical protein C5167_031037, partial [Papaver somniferum]